MSAIDIVDGAPLIGSFAGQFGKKDTMEAISVVGIDLAKSVFQVHGVDAQGQEVVRKRHIERPHQQVEDMAASQHHSCIRTN